jgi:hypothetical protein
MKDFFNLFYKTAIVVFVIWHGAAIVIYATPRDDTQAVTRFINGKPLAFVTPYLLVTSQWQLWNIFAPEPIRRVTSYRTDIQVNGEWKELTAVRPGTLSVWRHSTLFKLYGNILSETSDNREVAADRYMHLQCEEFNLEPETPMRVSYEVYVIPKHDEPKSRAWWDAWKPEIEEREAFYTECPPAE